MEVNECSKVLIIDDQYEEISPIIKALSTKGIFTIYWDGNVETKPEQPLVGIRFVFLDMRFSVVTDQHSINTNLFTLLRNAISIVNGPYILLIWSKHDSEYLEGFKQELYSVKGVPKPYLIINMEKSNFIKWEYEKNEIYDEISSTVEFEGKQELRNEILEILENNNINKENEVIQIRENVIEELLGSLENNLKKINSLKILFMWEDLVNKSAMNLVNDITKFSDFSNSWDNNIKALIQNLAMANAGKSLGSTAREYVINALSAFNQMLPDELWNQLNEKNIDEETFEFMSNPSIIKSVASDVYSISKTNKTFVIMKNNSDYGSFKDINKLKENMDKELCEELYNNYLEVLGKSNFKLLCERVTSKQIKKPGNVYKVIDSKLLKDLINTTMKKEDDELLSKISLIKLDISSTCDYAQDKLKRVRILPGLMIPENYFQDINDSEDIFCTPELKIDDELVKISFNFHYITNEAKVDADSSKIVFSFRELLLSEIKHKLSSHISRIGIINL